MVVTDDTPHRYVLSDGQMQLVKLLAGLVGLLIVFFGLSRFILNFGVDDQPAVEVESCVAVLGPNPEDQLPVRCSIVEERPIIETFDAVGPCSEGLIQISSGSKTWCMSGDLDLSGELGG